MKQSFFVPQTVVRKLTLAASVLGVALVAGAAPAKASGIPLPHEVIRDVHEIARSHVRHVARIVDHVVVRHDVYRPYPGPVRYYRPYRPAYRYPVVVRGHGPYRPYYRGYVGAYVAVPSVSIVVGARPGRDVYRGDDCERNDGRHRDGDYDDDRRQYDEDDD